MSEHMLSYIKSLELLGITLVNKQAVWMVGLQLQEMNTYSTLHLFSCRVPVATHLNAAKWTHREIGRMRGSKTGQVA